MNLSWFLLCLAIYASVIGRGGPLSKAQRYAHLRDNALRKASNLAGELQKPLIHKNPQTDQGSYECEERAEKGKGIKAEKT